MNPIRLDSPMKRYILGADEGAGNVGAGIYPAANKFHSGIKLAYNHLCDT